ncbi:MAG: prenyltransferase/squalene oxidase repeat-containing protein [Candidatus Thorarchaeota archaeon]
MKRVKVFTIAIAFVLVLIAASAQPVAAASRSDTLNSYITSRYDALRGGYSPPSDSVVRVDATYGAILALDELGNLNYRPPPINLTKALESLTVRQWLTNNPNNDLDKKRYGGFSEYLVGPVTMEMTFMGMVLHQLLKAQSDYPGINAENMNATAVLVYLNRTQSTVGGFSSRPGDNPDILSTYQALAIFQMLDDFDDTLNAWDWLANETATIEWINSCREDNVFKLSPTSYTTSLTATAAGIMALGILQEVLTIPGLQAANDWILERQMLTADSPVYLGGFEEGNGTEDANFATTYYALKVLKLTGAISAVNVSAAIDFILRCQAADGSWGNIPGMEEGSLVYSGQACELLNILSNAGTILASTEDPNSPGGIVLDWRVFVVGGILLVALVLAIVSVRTD